MERQRRFKWRILAPGFCGAVMGLLVTLAVACTQAEPQQAVKDEHGHEHEHEHTMSHEEEHGIPPHKPRSFVAAIEQIDRRGHALLSHRHGHHITEWFDILGWLPELAGDTDLKKTDWDEAARIATELEQWSAPWRSSEKVSLDVAVLERHVAALKSLADKLPVPH